MIMLNERDVSRLMTTAEAVEVLEQELRLLVSGDAMNVPRRRARVDGFVMHMLGAASIGPALGAKIYLSGGVTTQFVYLLFDSTGLMAMIAADHLGRMRTGAASGLATKYLARRDANKLVIFGSGNQARYQVEAICAVRPIEQIVICARNGERATHFAAQIGSSVNAEVTIASDIASALAQTDVVCTMTSAPEPLFDGNDLPARVHVNAAGSNRATHREIDRSVLDRAATIFVDDIDQARLEAGDFLRNGDLDWDRIRPLGEIFSFEKPPSDGITLFESLGIGLWDLALASEIVQRAASHGVGTKIDLTEFFS